MRLNYIPRIDVYQLTRSTLKTLKLKSSQGGQANALMEKSNHIAHASRGTIDVNDHSVTLADTAKKKLNVI